VIFGRHKRATPNVFPFPNTSGLTGREGVRDFVDDGTPGAPQLELFDEDGWIDIAPFEKAGVIHLSRAGIEGGEMRLEMMRRRVGEAEAVIVLGGGKATRDAVQVASDAKKLIAIGPFCAGGHFSEIESAAVAKLKNLESEMRRLVNEVGGDLKSVARAVPQHLAKLVRSERSPKIVVITMRSDEFEGVRRHLVDAAEWQGKNKTYLTGVVQHGRGPLRIGLLKTPEQGNPTAQDLTRSVIEDTDPDLIVLCGIAGGLTSKDLTLADVVVSTRLHDFSTGAALEGGKREFINQGGPLTAEVQRLVARLDGLNGMGLLKGWNDPAAVGVEQPDVTARKRIHANKAIRDAFHHHFRLSEGSKDHYIRREPVPRFNCGAIASNGDLLRDPELAEQLRQAGRDVLAFDMEFAGAYHACRRTDRTYNLVAIRGISDVIGQPRHYAWTGYAAFVAGSFCNYFIKTLPDEYQLKTT
jgi:nucleoside phosphorylase